MRDRELFSRSVLDRMIAQGIAMAQRSRMRFAVVYVDLDYFGTSTTRSVRGRRRGIEDRRRTPAAHRVIRRSSRQGGDEFVMLLNGITCPQDVTPIAKKSSRCCGSRCFSRRPSCGWRPASASRSTRRPSATASLLLRHADLALVPGRRGRNDYCFYVTSCSPDALTGRLARAGTAQRHRTRQFRLHFSRSSRWRATRGHRLQTLLRWQHQRGLLAATDFIRPPSGARLIVPIGQWVLNEACRQARRWRGATRSGGTPGRRQRCRWRSCATDFVADAEAALKAPGCRRDAWNSNSPRRC